MKGISNIHLQQKGTGEDQTPSGSEYYEERVIESMDKTTQGIKEMMYRKNSHPRYRIHVTVYLHL